jgi:hypothetical protein
MDTAWKIVAEMRILFLDEVRTEEDGMRGQRQFLMGSLYEQIGLRTAVFG